jgi:hypothetical protein
MEVVSGIIMGLDTDSAETEQNTRNSSISLRSRDQDANDQPLACSAEDSIVAAIGKRRQAGVR